MPPAPAASAAAPGASTRRRPGRSRLRVGISWRDGGASVAQPPGSLPGGDPAGRDLQTRGRRDGGASAGWRRLRGCQHPHRRAGATRRRNSQLSPAGSPGLNHLDRLPLSSQVPQRLPQLSLAGRDVERAGIEPERAGRRAQGQGCFKVLVAPVVRDRGSTGGLQHRRRCRQRLDPWASAAALAPSLNQPWAQGRLKVPASSVAHDTGTRNEPQHPRGYQERVAPTLQPQPLQPQPRRRV